MEKDKEHVIQLKNVTRYYQMGEDVVKALRKAEKEFLPKEST